MTFTFTFAWWWIPTLITLMGLIWVAFFVDPGDGIGAGLNSIFALVPVLFISALAWAIAGALK